MSKSERFMIVAQLVQKTTDPQIGPTKTFVLSGDLFFSKSNVD